MRNACSCFAVAVALFVFSVPSSRAEESHPRYCKTRELGASSWKTIVTPGPKSENPSEDLLCPEPCGPDCMGDPKTIGYSCYSGFCPDALPAPGNGVHLAMVSGAWRVKYEGWEVDVGFGDMRPLNLLTRARLTPDGKTVRMFFPSNQLFSQFTRVKENEYLLDAEASILPPGSTFILEPEAKRVTLKLSDGQQWDFEGVGTFRGADQVYRKTRTVERQGWTTRYEYAPNGIVITDAADNRYEIRHGEDKRITEIVVADRSWKYEYDGKADVVTEIEPSGARTSVAVGNANRFAGVVRDGGVRGGRRTTRVDIDEQGLVTATWDGGERIDVKETLDGDRWSVELDVGGVKRGLRREGSSQARRVDGNGGRAAESSQWANLYDTGERTDALGRTWLKSHDANGRVTREVSPSGIETRYAYDERGNRVVRLTSEGAWRYEYDEQNRMVAETAPTGAVARFAYDPATGNVSQKTDALGNLTKYTYDARGQMLSVAGPFAPGEKEPPARKFEYDRYGNQIAATDELGHTTRSEYDIANNLVKRIDAAGNATRYEYDGLQRKTKEIDALGGTTEWVYDDRGLVVEVKGSVAASGGHGGCASCGGASGVYEKPGKYEYNAARMLTKYTDILGNATKYEYNDLGQQVAVTDALGAVTRMEYDLIGNLLARTDPLGHVTRYEYDALGQMVATVNPLGARTQYVYDAEGRQIAVIGPDGGTQRSEYDALGRLSRTIAANGGITAYEYNPAGQMVRQTNAAGMVTEYTYDSDGRMIQTVTDAKGFRQTTRSEYNAAGQIAASHNPLGNATRYEYGANGQLVKTVSPGGAVSAFAYDALGRRIRATDPVGRVATSEYAPGGQELVASGRGGPAVTWYTYDELGRRLTTEGLDRAKEEYAYDAVGRVVESRVAGSVTRRQYDLAGNMIASTDPLGNTTTFTYNAAGQLTATTDPLGTTTRHEYDATGRRTKTLLPEGGVREYTYNEAGQLAETRGGPEGVKRYEYDLLGRQTAVVDANNRRKTTQYDTLGRVVRIANEMNQPVLYEYDLAGNRIGLTDANGNKTVWEYDVDGRQTSMTFPNGDREEYKYDAGGKLVEKKTPNGEYIRFNHDPKTGFLMRVDVEGDVPYVRELYTGLWEEAKKAGLNPGELNFAERNFSVVYTRDEQGRVLTETCPQTTMRHAYNEKGQLQSVTDTALNATLHYEYDERGLRTKMSFDLPNDPNKDKLVPILYKHDENGRLTHIGREGEGMAVYEYDQAGRRTKLTYPNGVVTTYAYTNEGNLTNITAKGPKHDEAGQIAPGTAGTGEVLMGLEYLLDPTGNRIGINQENGDELRYAFDNAYRLTRETRINAGKTLYDQTFEYDPLGNRLREMKNVTETIYKYNSANQLISTNGQTQQHDKNGNMIFTNGQDATLLQFDALNRLIQFTSRNESYTASFKGTGWKRHETIDKQNNLFYVYNGDETLADILGGHIRTTYLSSGLDQKASLWSASDNTKYWYISDGLNSTRRLTNSTGIVTGQYDYRAFGELTNVNVSKYQRFGFTGREWLTAAATQYKNYRNRIASGGRWISRDPIHYYGDLNIYSFIGNKPLVHIDPYGLKWQKTSWDTYEADCDGDTLESLARLITGINADAECIWPMSPDTFWENYPIAKKGARANVGNLKSYYGETINITIIQEGYNWPGWYDTNVKGGLEYVKEKSGEGATPLMEMNLAAHGAGSDRKSNILFSPLELERIATVFSGKQTFSHAKARRGPTRCWFTKQNPIIRILGCEAVQQDGPQSWARQVLRGGYSVGPNVMIYFPELIVAGANDYVTWKVTKTVDGVDHTSVFAAIINPVDSIIDEMPAWEKYYGRK